MPNRRVVRLFTFAVLSAVFAAPSGARDRTEEKRDEVRRMRDQVLAQLHEAHPAAKTRIRDAAGYAVFSNVGLNVLFASVAGGSGLVVEHRTPRDTETFITWAPRAWASASA